MVKHLLKHLLLNYCLRFFSKVLSRQIPQLGLKCPQLKKKKFGDNLTFFKNILLAKVMQYEVGIRVIL